MVLIAQEIDLKQYGATRNIEPTKLNGTCDPKFKYRPDYTYVLVVFTKSD